MIKIKQKITGENILSKCVTVIRNEHTTVQIVCECAGGGGVGRGWGLFYSKFLTIVGKQRCTH